MMSLTEMSLEHTLERSSVGICMLCVGLVLLLWNSQRILLLCYLPFFVYEETYTCLSIVGLRVEQQVGTLESCVKLSSFLRTSLRAISRPVSCCLRSLLLPVLAHVHLLVMFLHCMLQSSVALPCLMVLLDPYILSTPSVCSLGGPEPNPRSHTSILPTPIMDPVNNNESSLFICNHS